MAGKLLSIGPEKVIPVSFTFPEDVPILICMHLIVIIMMNGPVNGMQKSSSSSTSLRTDNVLKYKKWIIDMGRNVITCPFSQPKASEF
jgi:hypothetical protein